MTHFYSILWLLSWPLVIYISYRLGVFMLRVFEKNLPREQRTKNL
jgi:hypothetical protein